MSDAQVTEEVPEEAERFDLQIGTLDVTDGDIVALRLAPEMYEQGQELVMSVAHAFKQMLDGQGYPNCVVLVLSPGSDVIVLDDDKMAELGWVRSPQQAQGAAVE